MVVGIQTLKGLFLLETVFTKEKVVTVLAHVAVLYDLYLTRETLVFLLVVHLRLEDYLHVVVGFVVTGGRVGFWTLEVALLTWVRRRNYIACSSCSMCS